ncbi:hypothetical protein [Flavobacterium columnare]|uniref:hypothetical protein n=1 Tax=Flavobacterium columnare TaxID=996 RepID=UPI002989E83E|nr:hypothetical protein [Flavobacterium columnare]MCH4828900.1 hypothetical protein [Flavobacterium columnare]
MEVTKTVSKWWIVQLCNADVIYEQAKERYDRAIQWLTKLSKGTVNLEDLAQLDSNASTTERQPFSSGSRANLITNSTDKQSFTIFRTRKAKYPSSKGSRYSGTIAPKSIARTRQDCWVNKALVMAGKADNPKRWQLYNLFNEIRLDALLTSQIETEC